MKLEKIFKDSLDDIRRFTSLPIPTKLYKYCSDSSYYLDNIDNGYLHLSEPTKFNDPYEGYATFIKGISEISQNITRLLEQEIDNYDKEVVTEALATLEEVTNIGRVTRNLLNELTEIIKIHIACLTEKNNDILMWSHYANNHQGICLEYNSKEIERDLYQVQYTDKVFCFYDIFHEYVELGLSGSDSVICTINFLYTVKYSQWKYENEWRIIEGEDKYLIKPSAIYMGTQIPTDDKEKVIELSKKHKIKLFQMKLDNDEYKLISTEVI